MNRPPLSGTGRADFIEVISPRSARHDRRPWTLVACIAAIVALFCLSATSVAQTAPVKSDQIGGGRAGAASPPELEQAVAKFNQQQYEEVLQLLNVASTKSPDLPPGRAMLARLFVQANQLPTARAMLEQTVLESPNDPEAYRMLGDMAFAERRLVESDLLFEKLAHVASEFNGSSTRKANYEAAAHAGLAAVAEARQQWDAAQEHLTAWLAKDPKNAGAHHRLGQTLFGLDKPDEAYQELQTAASIAKEYPAPKSRWVDCTINRETRSRRTFG